MTEDRMKEKRHAVKKEMTVNSQRLIHSLTLEWCWIINYNSKREDLEEEDQRQDERNVIL